MAVNPYNHQPQKVLKSIRAEHFAFITFKCQTTRKANLYWLNYEGQKIKYATLCKGAEFVVTTFETHPWIFRDAVTNDVLVANRQHAVFYPKPWAGEEEVTVTIDKPVYSLKELCIQFFRASLRNRHIRKLEIPGDLIRDILDREDTSHGVYYYVDPDIH